MNKAILFAAPGTSSEGAASAFRNIDRMAGGRFGDVPRSWAYTSSGVRRKLARDGRQVDGPSAALVRLRGQGVTHIAVRPLHLTAGMEYGELREAVERATDGSDALAQALIGQPLLGTPGLLGGILENLLAEIPVDDADREALVLVGHGTRHPKGQAALLSAADFCRGLDRRVLLGAIMPPPGVADVMRECREQGVRRAYLVPFTIAAGYSAERDIAGPGPESWRTALEREGIACVPVLRGLGEYDGIVELWLDTVAGMLDRMA